MEKEIKYEFESNDLFMIILFPAVILPFYYNLEMNFIFKILIYLAQVYLLYCFDYNKMVIYNDYILHTKYIRPFSKTYKIEFSDVEKVFINRSFKYSDTLVVKSKTIRKRFIVSIYRGIFMDLSLFFIAKKIKLETNDSKLRNDLSHYLLRHKQKTRRHIQK
ncbi:MAG: hypothetical protein KAZ71_01055 [Bacteroidia bacterium]|nr:hypothetical protein [Bacteroidia bacterium]